MMTHDPNLRAAAHRHTLLATALATAALCLSGCAALQIDVDVYKGPLVHDEDTQIQQLASIAMSGKAVMLVQRNKWLDTVSSGWRAKAGTLAKQDPSKSLLTRFIRNDEWKDLEVCTQAETECRHARLINDMLSAYEDKAEPSLAHVLGRMRTQYRAYLDAQRDYEKAADTPGSEVTKAPLLQAATEALRQTWGALMDLLIETKRLMADSQGTDLPTGERLTAEGTGLRAVERQTTEILARLTDLARLVCANPALPLNGEVVRGLRLATEAIEQGRSASSDAAKNTGDSRAIGHFNASLRLASADELLELKRAMDVRTSVTGCVASEVFSPSVSSANKANIRPRVTSRLGETRLGVQREATDDAVVREIDELLRDLEQTKASGFDHGRPPLGLDRLADEAANDRSKRRTSENGTGATGDLADSAQTKQLQDSVVDLASRMQFLAVNLQLVDQTNAPARAGTGDYQGLVSADAGLWQRPETNQATQDARAFKATLEVIANSLLVLAEDQRRQRSYRGDQQAFADNEYQSAVLAFQIDPARRFDHLVEHYRTRKAAALKSESDSKVRTESAVQDAQKARAEADKRALARGERLQPWLALALTLGVKLPEGALAALATEEAKAFRADAAQLRRSLAAAPAKLSLGAQKELIEKWLETEAGRTGTQGGPRHRRLLNVRASLVEMRPTDNTALPRAEALARLERDIAEGWAVAAGALVEAQNAALVTQTKLRAAEMDLNIFNLAPRPSSRIQDALDIVLAMRSTVLAQAAAAKGAHDVDTLTGLVKVQLQALAKEKADARTEALAQLDQWAAGARPPVKLPENSKNVKKGSALETLNRIEAFLSYTRVDALNRGSTAGAEQASAALDALMARRERMSYLRPASTYLRSALATTGQQTDPSLDWSNLLVATVKRLADENDISKKRERTVRGELDKSFWQNVNKVRLSAGGSSNFAIAKDDVGNWYVKAMGGDLEPMIKAAKNLALYNIGGRVDTNLLRIDELRNKTGRVKGDADDIELKDLLDRQNGAAASAYGSTLQVFSDNHSKTVKALLASLDETLQLQTHYEQLRARWTTTYTSSAPKLDALKLALHDPALLTLHDKALTATEAVDPQPVGSTPSSQLLEGLDLVAQQRSRIKVLVAQTELLTKSEVAAAETQRKVVSDQEALLTAAQAEQTALLQKRVDLLEQQNKLTNDKIGEIDLLTLDINDKQKQANDKGLQVAALRAKLLEERATAAKLGLLADGAQTLKARALDDVDAVLQKLVKDTANKQLRSVEEFETAARVVSQGVQGKATKP